MGQNSTKSKSGPTTITGENFVCQPEMRDPLTLVNSYLVNPSPMRCASQFLLECYSHSVYLEGEQACPHAAIRNAEGSNPNTTRVFPVLLQSKHVEAQAADGSAPPLADATLHFRHLTASSLPRLCNDLVLVPFHKISVTQCPGMRALEHSALSTLKHVTEITIDNLPALDSIGDRCLEQQPFASKLNVVKVGSLPKLTSVGSKFLYGATAIKEFDFCRLPALRTVGDFFLGGCHVLKSIRISDLPELQSLGRSFLVSCSKVESVTLSDLPSLTKIGGACLFNCNSMTIFRMANLPSLQEIGDSFLCDCKDLKEATFEGLPELAKVGGKWMHSCTALDRLTFSNVPKLADVGSEFLMMSKRSMGLKGSRSCRSDGEYPIECKVSIGDDCHPNVQTLVSGRTEKLNSVQIL